MGLVVLAAAAACAARGSIGGAPVGQCEPMAEPLSPRESLAPLSGAYVLRLVATRGAAAGRSAVGELVLRPHDSSRVVLEAGVETPFFGHAVIPLEDVGAVRMGDLASADPDAPGVAVYVTRDAQGATTSAVIRLGSSSNRRGQMLFDAGYTVLFLRSVESSGFKGGWASAVERREVSGHFCAQRVSN